MLHSANLRSAGRRFSPLRIDSLFRREKATRRESSSSEIPRSESLPPGLLLLAHVVIRMAVAIALAFANRLAAGSALALLDRFRTKFMVNAKYSAKPACALPGPLCAAAPDLVVSEK